MTVISTKSITGVTSITSPQSDDAVTLHTNDTTQRVSVTTGGMNVTGVITATSFDAPVTGDFSIADKIVHTGDTNTALRFPTADTVSVETGGSERLRIDSSGKLLVGKEVVEYDGTLNNDRFTISARGVNGTVESDHLAGDYFRTLGKYN